MDGDESQQDNSSFTQALMAALNFHVSPLEPESSEMLKAVAPLQASAAKPVDYSSLVPGVATGPIERTQQPPPYGCLKSGPQANYTYRPTPPSVLPYVQRGTVVCFYNGGNHLQMCTGFKNGEPIWVSDTKQGPYDTNFFPNSADEHCQYAVFQPNANFDVDKAVKNLENMVAKNDDYTGNCAEYVRVGALEVGEGRAIAPSKTGTAAGYAHGLMENIGFTRVGEGSGSNFVRIGPTQSPTSSVMSSRTTKSPDTAAAV